MMNTKARIGVMRTNIRKPKLTLSVSKNSVMASVPL
jgi:hypothetical protein